ncbi:MAG: OB-fold nucleic acid binding domain-containing protein, partial [Saprospiraceae bacterium]
VPTTFEDLIAMNALYRPGPLEYIPDFIERKHGRQAITYDLPAMEEYLKETYGICVYQEQVMLLSQKLANFSKGEADMLRKAMGKKKKKLIDQMHPQFIEGGESNGHPAEVLNKVWKDWEAFASYAFNKSHSTCYAFIAFQTAYLKAHYPAEFMASVLTHNKTDITKLTFFLRECKRMGLTVLGPHVNESQSDFSVNKKGQIRFGMSGLKGLGEGPVEAILEERKNGDFKNVFDLLRRSDLKSVNKRALEALTLGGGFDCFEDIHRAQYFAPSEKYSSFLEHLLRYGNAYQNQKAQAMNSLFGASEDAMIPEPSVPEGQSWSLIEKLNREREVTGIYISGHPLDDYRIEVENFITCPLDELEKYQGRDNVKVAGIVLTAQHRISKRGTGFGICTLQDYNAVIEFPLFGDDYVKFKEYMEEGQVLFIRGDYKQKWSGDGFQFKPKEVTLLESVGKNMTECITLKIPIERVTDDFINNIDNVCRQHHGQHRLRMTLVDKTNRLSLTFKSHTKYVNVDNDFVQALDKMGLEYKLN